MDNQLFWSEKQADQAVILTLIKELNRRYPMSKLALVDGVITKLHTIEKMTIEEAEQLATEMRDQLTHLESLIAEARQAQAPAPAAQPETPAQPVEQPQPAAPETLAQPVEQTQPSAPAEPVASAPEAAPVAQPEQQPAPVEQPAVPEAQPVVLQ